MKVKILCEFEVESKEDWLDENVAKSAASLAAYDYLAFVKVSGKTTDPEWVDVHVDGFGECRVKVGEGHE